MEGVSVKLAKAILAKAGYHAYGRVGIPVINDGTTSQQEEEASNDEKRRHQLIDQLLCTNRDDPQNALYLAPLARAEDEQMAHSMADVIYCACADNFTDDITKEEADRVWEQCLIDARRMIYEPEYEDIFIK